MQRIPGLALVILGGVLVVAGWSRWNSLAGDVAAMSARVASRVDGRARVPEPVYYLGGGVLLVLAGATLALRKSA